MERITDQARLTQAQALSVQTREEFIDFVYALNRHLEAEGDNPWVWENDTLDLYLGAIGRVTANINGAYRNRNEPIPEPSWNLFARILLSAGSYE